MADQGGATSEMVIAVSAAIGVAVTAAGAIGQWFVLSFRTAQNADEIAEHREALAEMKNEQFKFRETVVANYVQRPEMKAMIDRIEAIMGGTKMELQTNIRESEARLERAMEKMVTKARA